MEGEVVWFSRRKQFGFLKPSGAEEGGSDLFIHASAVGDAVVGTGDKVTYEVGERDGKQVAINVRVTSKGGSSKTPKAPRAKPASTKKSSGKKKASRVSDVVVVGATNIDLIAYVPRLPKMGETLAGESFSMGFGGKGNNQAAQAAKLGAKVAMITKVGKDQFGRDALKNYRALKMDCAGVLEAAPPATTGVAQIAVDPQGNNSIVIVTCANDLLTPEDIQALSAKIQAAKVLVCQLETSVAVAIEAMRIARAAGEGKVTTIFNPAPATGTLPDELFALCDVIVPNETEAELLTGIKVADEKGAREAEAKLKAKGCRHVCITLGEKGALLDGEMIPAPKVDKVVDTSGAGDSFIGGMAQAVGRGKSLKEAAVLGIRVASLSVQNQGTQKSYVTAKDLEDQEKSAQQE